MKLDIVPARRHHLGKIARSMRVEHAASLMRMQVPIHGDLCTYYERSYYARSAFLDGHLCAVWGAEGSPISSTCSLWLVLSQYALRFPVTILRQAKKEIEYLARTKTMLVTTVIPDDAAAQRLVAFLGFEAPDGFGGGPARTRSARGNLIRYLMRNPDLMIPAGSAQQIGVIWRREYHSEFLRAG